MGKIDSCSNQPSLASVQKCDIDIELSERAVIATSVDVVNDAHSEEEHPLPLVCASKTSKSAQKRHLMAFLARESAFYLAVGLAVTMAMAVLGSSLVLLNIYASNNFGDLAYGIESGVNETHSSKFGLGQTLPVKLEHRDGTDPQSSSGGLMEGLYSE